MWTRLSIREKKEIPALMRLKQVVESDGVVSNKVDEKLAQRLQVEDELPCLSRRFVPNGLELEAQGSMKRYSHDSMEVNAGRIHGRGRLQLLQTRRYKLENILKQVCESFAMREIQIQSYRC